MSRRVVGRLLSPRQRDRRSLALRRPPPARARACEIADADGIDAVSMRSVGRRLGVAPMGLYRYVPNKARLLEAMVEHVAGRVTTTKSRLPTGACRCCRLVRQQRSHHRPTPLAHGPRIAPPPVGPATLAYVERALSLFAGRRGARGVAARDRGLVQRTGDDTGSSATTTEPATNDRAATRDRQQALLDLLATGNYPRFAALAQRELPPHLDLDEQFDRLVERVIDGLA